MYLVAAIQAFCKCMEVNLNALPFPEHWLQIARHTKKYIICPIVKVALECCIQNLWVVVCSTAGPKEITHDFL